MLINLFSLYKIIYKFQKIQCEINVNPLTYDVMMSSQNILYIFFIIQLNLIFKYIIISVIVNSNQLLNR